MDQGIIDKLIPIAGTNNRVVIKRDVTEEKTGLIILAEGAKQAPNTGIVISVSEKDADGYLPTVKKGDRVMFNPAQYIGIPLLKNKDVDIFTTIEKDIFLKFPNE